MNNQTVTPPDDQLFANRLSISQLADLIGVRRQTLAEKLTALELPFQIGKQNAKTYLVSDVLKKLFRGVTVTGSEPINKLDAEKLLHMAAKREQAELSLQKSKGEVVSIAEVLSTIADEYSLVRGQLQTLGQSLARELAVTNNAEDVAKIIEAKVAEILEALQADAKRQFEDTAQVTVPEIENPEDDNDELT